MADKTAGTLNQLIAVCRDAEEFYGYAAEKVSGSQLQPLLRDAAEDHCAEPPVADRERFLPAGRRLPIPQPVLIRLRNPVMGQNAARHRGERRTRGDERAARHPREAGSERGGLLHGTTPSTKAAGEALPLRRIG